MPVFTRLTIAAAITTTLLLGSTAAAAPALAADAKVAASTVHTSKVRTWAKTHYGTFPTWRRTGEGDDLLTLPKSVKAASVVAHTDGESTIELKPVWKASSLPKSHTGDGVYLFDKPAGALRLTHSGSADFIVTQHTGGALGWNLLVNEIGHYRGTVPTEGGPSMIDVEADGRWTTHYR